MTGKELGRMLFRIHTHGDLVRPDEVVYREKDIVKLLVALGHPKAKFTEDQQEVCVVCGKRATYWDERFSYSACDEHKDTPPADLHKIIAEYKNQKP